MHFASSQRKYFYFFSFFFFRHAFRLRSRRFLLKRSGRNHRRRRRILRNRLSTFSLMRKSTHWKVFKFRNFFKYVWRLHNLKRRLLGSRSALLRFIHFYFFMYVFYFKSLAFFRKSFFFYNRKGLKRPSIRLLKEEFRLYRWCVGHIFRRHKKIKRLFSRIRPRRLYGSFASVNLRLVVFYCMWKLHGRHV